MSNTLKTTLLLGLLTGLLLWVGQALGGAQGLVIGLVFAAVMNLGSYWFSDKIVLRMYGARELPPEEAPDLYVDFDETGPYVSAVGESECAT